MAKYFLARGHTPDTYSQLGLRLATDSLVEALFERNLRNSQDDSTSWNAKQHGPWNVVDTTVKPWRFVGEPEPDWSGLDEFKA